MLEMTIALIRPGDQDFKLIHIPSTQWYKQTRALLLDGMIEPVIVHSSPRGEAIMQSYVDEDGHSKGLPKNVLASALYSYPELGGERIIVGPMVLMGLGRGGQQGSIRMRDIDHLIRVRKETFGQ